MIEKRVLIFGGGVAALATAVALVESNQKNNPVTFRVHIITQAHRWGGRASSWYGGHKGEHVDLSLWPKDFILNHGFHAIFHESTYQNFWHTLRTVWASPPPPKQPLEKILISNNHEILIYENETVCRLPVHPALGPCSHLTRSALELLLRGGWSLCEMLSFRDVVLREVFRHGTFEQLLRVDEEVDAKTGRKFPDVGFTEWCRARGLKESVPDKALFQFIFDGSYVSPFDMDTASAIKALWILLRSYRSTEWYYIQGGITQDLMNPIATYLVENNVGYTMICELISLTTEKEPTEGKKWIRDCRATQVRSHPYPCQRDDLIFFDYDFPNIDTASLLPDALQADYYISTLPLENLWPVIQTSRMVEDFGNVRELMERGDRSPSVLAGPTVGTVNLQVWFQDRVMPEDLTNVVAGFEPLCVMVDYKNFLPLYQDDQRWPGSVIEINGSEAELRDWCRDHDWGDLDQLFGCPQEPRTIEFAKRILSDFAIRFGFEQLGQAVKRDAFLRNDKGELIPPFLWRNMHKHNRFFVTEPGILHLRPGTRTPYANFFLAGDWTRNGIDIPCMEGAARSGRMAALEVQKQAGCSDLIEVYNPG